MDKKAVQDEVLECVKETFEIGDNLQDKYIKQLTSNTFDEFRVLTGSETIKKELLFVIEGVVNKRYVRRGSDGIESEKSSGLWITYKDDQTDFEEYKGILSVVYSLKDNGTRKRAKVVRFR